MSNESELWGRRFSTFHLAPYLQCPACRAVIFDPDRRLGRWDQPAPCCGAKGEGRIIWPSAEIHDFLEIAGSKKIDTSEGKRIAIVFLATALEMLLESVLWELLAARDSSTSLSEVILEAYQGRDKRIGLFKTLSGKPVLEVLKAKKLEDFLVGWGEIAKARNDIVHGKYSFERTGDPQPPVKRVIEKCFEAFAELQNHAVSIKQKPL